MPAVSKTTPMVADIKASPNEFTSEHIAQALLLSAEKLPPKRVALVDAYIANGFNGARAYKAAGYKVKGPNIANTEAAKILSNPLVSNYLCWKLRQVLAQDDCQIDEGRLIRESSALAYTSLTDVISWDTEGKVTVKPSSEIPREVAAAVKKFKSTTRVIKGKDGDDDIETTTIEIELHDKKGALDLQARIAGMLRDQKVADHSNYTLNMFFGEPPKPKEKDVVAG